MTLHITPVANRNYVDDSDTRTAVVGFIGFAPHQHIYLKTVGITGVPGQIGHASCALGVDAHRCLPGQAAQPVGHRCSRGRSAITNGAVGVVGIGRISGDYARSNAITGEEKVLTLLGLLASINLLLFLFNLLPLLPLDGGHVAGAHRRIDAKRGRARLRARGRPAPVLGADGTTVHAAHRSSSTPPRCCR